MNIVVCIKQVPDTEQVRIDAETGTLIRSGVDSIINPYDLHAIEESVRIKESIGGKVIVITMGPPQAESALRESIARGADEAFLLTDKKFSGADTWATSLTLARCIKWLVQNVLKNKIDLVICGKQAIDGDTAQVGPGIAELMGVPHTTCVCRIRKINHKYLLAESQTDSGHVILKMGMPCLITVVKSINVPRLTNLSVWAKAINTKIHYIDHHELQLAVADIGLKGSPTRVKKIKAIAFRKKTVFFNDELPALGKKLLSVISDKKGENTKPFKKPVMEKIIDYEYKNENNNVIVIGQIENGSILPVSFELVFAAHKLAQAKKTGIGMVLIGKGMQKTLEKTLFPPVQFLYIYEQNSHIPFNAEINTKILKDFIVEYKPEIVLGGATVWGRSILPRLAVSLQTGITADCTSLEIDPHDGSLLQTRPAFGGNIMATIICKDKRPQMATVRPNVFPCDECNVPISRIKTVNLKTKIKKSVWIHYLKRTKMIKKTKIRKMSGNLLAANIIIAGGKGVGNRDGFALLEQLAHLLNASVAASRSAVDAGWVSYDRQVGQTGKTVQPVIYIACGISGAVQHLIGMQSSDIIIAINNDADAPIFKVADFAVINDWKQVVKSMLQELRHG